MSTMLTKNLQVRAKEMGMSSLGAQALGAAVGERISEVAKELDDLAAAFSIKSLNGRHVAYAWKQASLKKTLKSQSGGNPDTTLPAEYFGDSSWSYHPLAEVKLHEGSTDATALASRGALHYKELVHQDGGSTKKLFLESDLSATSLVNTKMNKDAMAAMAGLTNSFAALLMSMSKATNNTTPAALKKLARAL